MTWLSDAWDYVAGDSGGSDDDSWWGGITDTLFSPEAIVGGVTALGKELATPDPMSLDDKLAEKRALGQLEGELSLDRMKAELELKKSLGLLGGGGGGGGNSMAQQLAYYRDRDKYQGRLGAASKAVDATHTGTGLTVEAVKNLINGLR